MKLMFASDIHGSAPCCQKMLTAFEREGASRLILLGDLLYHGPRNPLPEGYSPAETAEMLNGVSDRLLCVRGNCEAEVDQMMLKFPVTADYAAVFTEDERLIFCTHGHLYDNDNNDKRLPLNKGDILIEGHSHIYKACSKGDIFYVNTGSVTLPKGGNVRSYVIYEKGVFTVRDMDGAELAAVSVN